jgi:hypothetical protein
MFFADRKRGGFIFETESTGELEGLSESLAVDSVYKLQRVKEQAVKHAATAACESWGRGLYW